MMMMMMTMMTLLLLLPFFFRCSVSHSTTGVCGSSHVASCRWPKSAGPWFVKCSERLDTGCSWIQRLDWNLRSRRWLVSQRVCSPPLTAHVVTAVVVAVVSIVAVPVAMLSLLLLNCLHWVVICLGALRAL